MDGKKVSYFNTLVFTIVSAIISVLLLLVLLMKDGNKMLPFIITLEIGIFCIIALCIVQIVMNERLNNRLKANKNMQMDFSTCPDYFTKRTFDNRELCANEYITVDERGQKYIMKMYPEDDTTQGTSGARPLPPSHTFDYKTDDPKYEKFFLTEIDSEKLLTTPGQKCAPLFAKPSDPNLQYLKGYDLVQWTTMRSKCASAQ